MAPPWRDGSHLNSDFCNRTHKLVGAYTDIQAHKLRSYVAAWPRIARLWWARGGGKRLFSASGVGDVVFRGMGEKRGAGHLTLKSSVSRDVVIGASMQWRSRPRQQERRRSHNRRSGGEAQRSPSAGGGWGARRELRAHKSASIHPISSRATVVLGLRREIVSRCCPNSRQGGREQLRGCAAPRRG